MSIPPKLAESEIAGLPNTPGVYAMHGVDEELLYVGKSVNVRDRVRSHFRQTENGRKQKRLFKETARIDVFLTAGDFGASLLELQHIKERQPLFNKQSRKKKQLVVLKEKVKESYLYPEISRTKKVNPKTESRILGVFKSKRQAKSVIENLAREHELCRQRLQIATKIKDGPCFYYQLGQCRGACIGEDDPDNYNRRFRKAFNDYAVRSWPFKGAVSITEKNDTQKDAFIIDNWVIKQAQTHRDEEGHNFFRSVSRPATFNYDTYKQIARTLLKDGSTPKVEIKEV